MDEKNAADNWDSSGCRWSYSGVEGALVFCVDKAKGGLWFRVVTLSVSDCSRQLLTEYSSAYEYTPV